MKIAKRFACQAEAFAIQNFDLLNPVEHVQILEKELRGSSDPARIRELQGEIVKAKENGANRSAEITIKGKAASLWEPALDALRSAIADALLLLANWETDAADVEREWFGEFAMERHPTPLSGQFASLIAELKKLNVSKTTFAWFGVDDIAEIE